ncbi:hypothetical protein BBF93_19335 [Hyphomonas sp. CACIAM 19H1]|uniref:TrbC/VirB2 family protein n=1 Tax=Hyphomonas sp. CACIAM 19H1 TaxID=1873716 RepID=UPI000DED8E75|nr:TrbC/VirB2 family protein [Hyphomonas sp. CACIAM 19H1]AXE66151.1 hypothetical protein BBF93_19335 [Hyphomonas sp. CACIAM 19H1]
MRKLLRSLSATTLAVYSSLNIAYAQSANWVQPGTDLLDALESGLVRVGGPVIGIGIIFLGIIGGLSGRVEWSKVMYVILGGLFITVGPAALRLLLSL